MKSSVGVLGTGMYLPAEVRLNDWWAPDVVARWAQRSPAVAPPPVHLTEGVAAVMRAMGEQARDPFQGSVARHVVAAGETGLDLEQHAARLAIEDAQIDAREIDLVLTCTVPTEHQLTNSACALHDRLGLRTSCFTLHTDGAQHSFLLQLGLAEAMIAAGRARFALLVQSSTVSRLLDYTSPISPMFGDGATAVVVGAVSPGRGILGSSHRTDGRHPNTLIASVPGATWYAEGRAVVHIADPIGMRDTLLRTVDVTTEGIAAALAESGLQARDVDVFVMHQGMPWLRRLVQEHADLRHTRSIDTFQQTAHLFASFLPSTLAMAAAQHVLSAGDVVVLAGGGNGMTYGATVVRWGR